MKLKNIKLVNYRNHKDVFLEFSPNINIFIGENGVGKTNILEAIYVLALTKSCRYGTDLDLIKSGENYLNIEGDVSYEDFLKKYKILIDKNVKKVFINFNLVKKISTYIGEFCVTSFLPNDMEIIKGAPSIRRNILNIQILILYNNYLKYVNEYNHLLKIRNDYLKRMNLNSFSDPKYLDVLNQKMIDISLKIYQFRFFYLKEMNNVLPNIYKKIAGSGDIEIHYDNSLGLLDYNEEEISLKLKQKYQKNLSKEMTLGMTIVGLHRDDITFMLNSRDSKVYASQGQQRLIVIAYKIAEMLIFKKIKGEYPVLLLDDIFSEIDIKRRNKIIKYLMKDVQVILTTTDISDIDKDVLNNAKIFKIKNGEIKVKGGAKCKKKK